jgi:flagellar motor switch protein FliN/FliY
MTGEPTAPPLTASRPFTDSDAGQFSQLWADSLAQVLGQIASAPLRIENLADMPAEIPAPETNDMQVVVLAAGSLRGEMSLRIPKVSAIGMARLFLGEPQVATTEFLPEHGQALEELLRQVAGYVATAVKPRWGEVQLQIQTAGAPSWAAGAGGWWGPTGAAPCTICVEWKLSAALHAALVAAAQPKVDPPSDADAPRSTARPPGSPMTDGNLELLMDVALEVTLRFGERNLLLREILELGAGSVVELDRKIGEPADLLLDGRIVARGEVVVVDGSYGLRVLEVVTPALGVLRGEP